MRDGKNPPSLLSPVSKILVAAAKFGVFLSTRQRTSHIFGSFVLVTVGSKTYIKLFYPKIKVKSSNFIPDIFVLFPTTDCVPKSLKFLGDLKSHGVFKNPWWQDRRVCPLKNCGKTLDLKHIELQKLMQF